MGLNLGTLSPLSAPGEPDSPNLPTRRDSNFPISSNGPESRDLGAPGAPDSPNTPNKRAELDSTACSAPTLPTSPDELSKCCPPAPTAPTLSTGSDESSKREEMSKVPIQSLPESQHHASN